jgi:hypothetical protein
LYSVVIVHAAEGRTMDIQASIVINRPTEAVFAYLASEEHIAVLGQRAGFGQEANEGKVEGEGKPRPYINIPLMVNPLQAQLQETRQVSEGESGRGTTFVQVYTWRDRTFETNVVISVYEPARTSPSPSVGSLFYPGTGRIKRRQSRPVSSSIVYPSGSAMY